MNYPNGIASIVYASDNRFAGILGISLTSLYANSKDMEDLIVYILDGGISEDNKEKLESVAETYNRKTPVFIPAKNIAQELKMSVSTDRGSVSQYARLFISGDLPQGLERVLYLDCDTIIYKSVSELWNLDMEGNTVAALKDAFSKYYRRNVDLEPDDVMFNSGVMLIDLKRWKEQKIEEKLLRFIVSKKGKIQQGRPGALNAVLAHEIYCLEPRFNSVTIFYDFTYPDLLIYRKPVDFYSEEQIRTAVDQPSIIHFTTSFLSKRPWVEGCRHKYVNEWMKYKKMSPWSGEPLWDNNQPKWKQQGVDIYMHLPKTMAIAIAGIMQAYGRPLKNWLCGRIV